MPQIDRRNFILAAAAITAASLRSLSFSVRLLLRINGLKIDRKLWAD